MLSRRVKADKLVDTAQVASSSEEPEQGEEKAEQSDTSYSGDEGQELNNVDGDHTDDSEAESDSKSPAPAALDALSTISFGALASAQESLGLNKHPRASEASRKRSRSRSPFHEASERRAGKKSAHPSRTSKHAPTELSSKKAVSRKRAVIPVSAPQARDPRFSALSGPVNPNKVEQNYSFLNTYRQSELAALKKEIRDTKDEGTKEELRRKVKAMEDRERARKRDEEMKEVAREHKKKEREAVKEGKKPFFLKRGELKQLALKKRYEKLGEKKAEKVIARRRKKTASKEMKDMPRARRGFNESGP